MAFVVEQQVKSGMGELRWIRIARYPDRATAEYGANRLERLNGCPARVVELPA